MKKIHHKDICSHKYAASLDTKIRHLVQNPYKLFSPYIQPGFHVLDYGCGPGFCTPDLAALVGQNGEVIAADIQPEMLDKVERKIQGHPYKDVIKLHQCHTDSTGLTTTFDFIVLFWMFHEVPAQEQLLNELKSLLNPGGMIMIVEPLVHVSKKDMASVEKMALSNGFKIFDKPQIFFSRSLLIG
ncbi:MAG TPA: class I SAM-dependent methyltransferase [Bacteroidaceae bacterium]|nr:class I SAM-dependent methyltransferase [Bacteroidaceae bacterium]